MAGPKKYQIIDELFKQAKKDLGRKEQTDVNRILDYMNKNIPSNENFTISLSDLQSSQERFSRDFSMKYGNKMVVTGPENQSIANLPERGTGFRLKEMSPAENKQGLSGELFFNKAYMDDFNQGVFEFVDESGVPFRVLGGNIETALSYMYDSGKKIDVDRAINQRQAINDLQDHMQYLMEEVDSSQHLQYFNEHIKPLHEKIKQYQETVGGNQNVYYESAEKFYNKINKRLNKENQTINPNESAEYENIINNDSISHEDINKALIDNLSDEELLNMTNEELAELAEDGDTFNKLIKRRDSLIEQKQTSETIKNESPSSIEENINNNQKFDTNVFENGSLSQTEQEAVKKGNAIWEEQKKQRAIEMDVETSKLNRETQKAFNKSGLMDEFVDSKHTKKALKNIKLSNTSKAFKGKTFRAKGKAGIFTAMVGAASAAGSVVVKSKSADDIAGEVLKSKQFKEQAKAIHVLSPEKQKEAAEFLLDNAMDTNIVKPYYTDPEFMAKNNIDPFRKAPDFDYVNGEIRDVNTYGFRADDVELDENGKLIKKPMKRNARPDPEGFLDDAADGMKKFGAFDALGLGVNVFTTIGDYKEARREGHGVVSSVARAGISFATGELLGFWGGLAVGAGKLVGTGVIKGTEALYKENRRMNSAANNQLFSDAQFADNQQLATMRQSGMEMAKMAQYNLQQTLMGNEATYLHR